MGWRKFLPDMLRLHAGRHGLELHMANVAWGAFVLLGFLPDVRRLPCREAWHGAAHGLLQGEEHAGNGDEGKRVKQL